MIEVLIAILVSVIGLFSAMKLQLTAVSNTHSAYFRSQAALITNALVDQMRANPTAAVAGNYDITLTGSVPGSGGMEVADLGQWRADLVATLPSATGSSAQQDIAFHRLFQPLALSLGFFSSAQQIVLHEYLIKNRPTALEILTASDSSKSPNSQPLIDIADMLPAADAFEYNLRYSSTANKLRATGFAFTEPQFKQTFKLVYPLSQRIRKNSTSPADQIEQRQQLHKLLGRDGALKVFSVLDSRFTALVTEGKRQGLTQEQLYFVYEIINQSEMQMLKGFQLRQRDHQAGINLIRRASQQRIDKLTSYLGEDIAQSLMKVFSQPGSVTAALSE